MDKQTQIQFDNLLNYIRSNYKINEYNTDEGIIFNIYDNIDLHQSNIDTSLKSIINKKFNNLQVDYMFPTVILLENGGTYNTKTDEYDKEKEFFTIKIHKN